MVVLLDAAWDFGVVFAAVVLGVVFAGILVAEATACERFLAVFFLVGVAAFASHTKAPSDTASKIAFLTNLHSTKVWVFSPSFPRPSLRGTVSTRAKFLKSQYVS